MRKGAIRYLFFEGLSAENLLLAAFFAYESI